MSELYTYHTDNQLVLHAPSSVAYVDIYPSLNGVPLNFSGESYVRVNPSDPGVFEYTLPYHMLNSEGTLDVRWVFTESGSNVEIEDSYEVVTPLVDINLVADKYSVSRDVAEGYESYARHVINAYTGQTFGKYVGPVTVYGNGQKKLFLPRRLISLTSVSPGISDTYLISGPNMFLNSSAAFKDNVAYTITGTWGYPSVPASVRAAAWLLIDKFSAEQPSYRDRYLTSIRSADWRLEYNSRAFDGTGLVDADQLLDPYVVHRIAVV